MLILCQHCNTPVFEVTQDGLLIIRKKHHGQEHTSIYRLAELQKESHPHDQSKFNTSQDCRHPGR